MKTFESPGRMAAVGASKSDPLGGKVFSKTKRPNRFAQVRIRAELIGSHRIERHRRPAITIQLDLFAALSDPPHQLAATPAAALYGLAAPLTVGAPSENRRRQAHPVARFTVRRPTHWLSNTLSPPTWTTASRCRPTSTMTSSGASSVKPTVSRCGAEFFSGQSQTAARTRGAQLTANRAPPSQKRVS